MFTALEYSVFCQLPYLETQQVCMRMIYTHNDKRTIIYGFAESHLNSYLNTVNYSQKLKKFFKGIRVKFLIPLNEDETEEFNQILP